MLYYAPRGVTCAHLRRKKHLAKPRRSKISVLLTEAELARFEHYCVERGYKKSTLIARLIRDYLDAEQARAQIERPLNRPEP